MRDAPMSVVSLGPLEESRWRSVKVMARPAQSFEPCPAAPWLKGAALSHTTRIRRYHDRGYLRAAFCTARPRVCAGACRRHLHRQRPNHCREPVFVAHPPFLLKGNFCLEAHHMSESPSQLRALIGLNIDRHLTGLHLCAAAKQKAGAFVAAVGISPSAVGSG